MLNTAPVLIPLVPDMACAVSVFTIIASAVKFQPAISHLKKKGHTTDP